MFWNKYHFNGSHRLSFSLSFFKANLPAHSLYCAESLLPATRTSPDAFLPSQMFVPTRIDRYWICYECLSTNCFHLFLILFLSCYPDIRRNDSSNVYLSNAFKERWLILGKMKRINFIRKWNQMVFLAENKTAIFSTFPFLSFSKCSQPAYKCGHSKEAQKLLSTNTVNFQIKVEIGRPQKGIRNIYNLSQHYFAV